MKKKSACLDNIMNKLLKIATEVVAPSLTKIFIQSIITGIFPEKWKEARVSPKTIQATTAQYRSFQLFQKFTKK